MDLIVNTRFRERVRPARRVCRPAKHIPASLLLSAANPGINPLEEIRAGVGRGTRPTAIGTIALPNPCSLVRLSTESVEEPPQLTGLGGNILTIIPNSGSDLSLWHAWCFRSSVNKYIIIRLTDPGFS